MRKNARWIAGLITLMLFVMSIVPVYGDHPDDATQSKWGQNAAGSCIIIGELGLTSTAITPVGQFTVRVDDIFLEEEKVRLVVNGESYSMSSHGVQQLLGSVEMYTFGINGNMIKIGFNCEGRGAPQEDEVANELVYCKTEAPTASGFEYLQTRRGKCGGEILSEEEYRAGVTGDKEALRELYHKKKAAYADARNVYLGSKQELQALRQAVQLCKKKGAVSCSNENMGLKLGIQKHLSNTIDMMEVSLSKLALRVESTEGLRGGQKEEFFGRISQLKERLNAQREPVADLTSDKSSDEEVRGVINELRHIWREMKDLQQDIVHTLVKNKTESVVDTVDKKLGNSIDARIADLKKKGAYVEEIQLIADEYDKKVETFKQAQQQWQVERQIEKKKEYLEQLQQSMKDVKGTLRDFTEKYKILKQEAVGANESVPTVPSAPSDNIPSDVPAAQPQQAG